MTGVRGRENAKNGKGQVAEATGAAVDFDPVVIFIMSLFASPTVPDNRIAQTLRTTAGNLFLAGSSPAENWVAGIHAKWDKENRTAWEALWLNGILPGSAFRRGLPLSHEIRMKERITPTLSLCLVIRDWPVKRL